SPLRSVGLDLGLDPPQGDVEVPGAVGDAELGDDLPDVVVPVAVLRAGDLRVAVARPGERLDDVLPVLRTVDRGALPLRPDRPETALGLGDVVEDDDGGPRRVRGDPPREDLEPAGDLVVLVGSRSLHRPRLARG